MKVEYFNKEETSGHYTAETKWEALPAMKNAMAITLFVWFGNQLVNFKIAFDDAQKLLDSIGEQNGVMPGIEVDWFGASINNPAFVFIVCARPNTIPQEVKP